MLRSPMLSKLLLLVILASFSLAAIADAQKTGTYKSTTTVHVQASGSNIEEARAACFRKAIQEAVGSVFLSSQEVRDGTLTKDQINEYAAGYVDRYEIIRTQQDTDGSILIDMNVIVASSKIAERMISSGTATLKLEGEQLKATLDSQIDARRNGDAFLNEVLASYPENAYIINQGKTEVYVDRNRKGVVEVSYDIKMSQTWLASFDEALSLISTKPYVPEECRGTFHESLSNLIDILDSVSVIGGPAGTDETILRRQQNNKCQRTRVGGGDIVITYSKNGDFFPTSHAYFMPDNITLQNINAQLNPRGSDRTTHQGLRFESVDNDGSSLKSACIPLPTYKFISFIEPVDGYNLNEGRKNFRPNIHGTASISGRQTLKISPESMGKISAIRLSVAGDCEWQQ